MYFPSDDLLHLVFFLLFLVKKIYFSYRDCHSGQRLEGQSWRGCGGRDRSAKTDCEHKVAGWRLGGWLCLRFRTSRSNVDHHKSWRPEAIVVQRRWRRRWRRTQLLLFQFIPQDRWDGEMRRWVWPMSSLMTVCMFRSIGEVHCVGTRWEHSMCVEQSGFLKLISLPPTTWETAAYIMYLNMYFLMQWVCLRFNLKPCSAWKKFFL